MTDFTPDGFRKLANRYHVASKESVALHQAADALDQRGRELASLHDVIRGMQEVIEGLRKELATAQKELERVQELHTGLMQNADMMNDELTKEMWAARAKVGAKQAHIDRLMLEFCPDEMTPEQLDEWGKRQVKVSPERTAEIERALNPTGQGN